MKSSIPPPPTALLCLCVPAVKAYPVNVQFRGSGAQRFVHLAMFFPMPFVHSARLYLTVESDRGSAATVSCSVGVAPLPVQLHSTAMYFHATYKDTPKPTAGKDVLMLDTRGIEGSDDWSGHIIGTVITFSHRGNLHTLEGDPRFFLDNSSTPQVQGTGTEEWGGGGDYWQGGELSSLPLVGHPTGVGGGQPVDTEYRFLLSDLLPFGNRAVAGIEHGGTDESTEHYESVVLWYGIPVETLVLTDHLSMESPAGSLDGTTPGRTCDPGHNYTASSPTCYTITSRYELVSS